MQGDGTFMASDLSELHIAAFIHFLSGGKALACIIGHQIIESFQLVQRFRWSCYCDKVPINDKSRVTVGYPWEVTITLNQINQRYCLTLQKHWRILTKKCTQHTFGMGFCFEAFNVTAA
jgi:hypothetical protein